MGLVLFRLGAEIGKAPTDNAPVLVGLVVGLLLIVASGFAQLYVAMAGRNELPASSLLRLTRREVRASNESLARLSEAQLRGYVSAKMAGYVASQSKLMAAMKTEEATIKLGERNAQAKRRLGIAHLLFAFALPFLVLTFSLWVYTGGNIREGAGDGHNGTREVVLRGKQ